MFQFGLFASHLPHLIIAAVYMIYFGACAFQSNEEGELEIDFDEAVTNNSYEQVKIESTIGFYDVYVEASASLNKQKTIDQYFLKTKDLYYLCEDLLHDFHHRSTLFSRPPPKC